VRFFRGEFLCSGLGVFRRYDPAILAVGALGGKVISVGLASSFFAFIGFGFLAFAFSTFFGILKRIIVAAGIFEVVNGLSIILLGNF
jgi:hypothetical protein